MAPAAGASLVSHAEVVATDVALPELVGLRDDPPERPPGRHQVRLSGDPRLRRGDDPIVLGESANTITTYGYDPATGMQEPKATLCQIRAA